MKLKSFFITLFIKQNKHHKHSVLIHTIKVFYYCLKRKNSKMLTAALLHDIGKPIVAYQKPEDILNNEYSFTDHEEKSYQMIKKFVFISDYTKSLVRYHYLIRGMEKAKAKGDMNKYSKSLEIWENLNLNLQENLKEFLICDDLGKGK